MVATTEILSVAMSADDRQLAVLASLPRRFRLAGSDRPDVHLVPSGAPDWADQLAGAIRDGARGALVTGAGPLELDALAALAASARAARFPVVVGACFVYDPAWVAALPAMRADSRRSAIIDSVAQGGEPVDLLTGQLAMLRPLLGDLAALRAAHLAASSYAVCAEIGESVLNLAGAVSLPGAPPLRIQLSSLVHRWDAVFNDAAPATPTAVTRLDATGTLTFPLRYESSHRFAWLALHAAITDAQPPGYGLDELLADRALATRLLNGERRPKESGR